jgi:PIN domain nuclease of toxin-antitoxin system
VALLLDTHAFLWWVDDAPQLSAPARTAIGHPDQTCFVSLASCWEIAAITLAHVARVAALPFHHRDPFDRLLVAQAIDGDLAIVSADPVFEKYGVRRVW